MRRLVLVIALLAPGCSALKAGWARVEWVDGKVSPVVSCTARVDAEGDVVMVCAPLNEVEADLLWKREKRRNTTGDL